MRASSLSWVLLTLSVVAAACSSEVTTDSSKTSTGAGGSGGSGTSSVVTSTGTGPTTSATASSSTVSTSSGGDTTCDKLCAKIEGECDLGDLCGMNQPDCSNPQAECGSQCLLDAPCSDIAALVNQQQPSPMTMACLQGCQGGSTGSGGGGGEQQCLQCTVQSCGGALQACQNDAKCQPWLGCIQNCQGQGPACFTACNDQFPAAAPGYGAIYACECQSCGAECTKTVDPCGQPISGTGGAGGGF
jgi:hypothetical protein